MDTFSPFYELNEARIIKLKELTKFLSPSLRVIRELSAKALYNLAQLAPEYSATHGRCALAVLRAPLSLSHTHTRVFHRRTRVCEAGPPAGFRAWGAENNVFLSCEKCKNWSALIGSKSRPVPQPLLGPMPRPLCTCVPRGPDHSRDWTHPVTRHSLEVGF